jgi:hypothetical protein
VADLFQVGSFQIFGKLVPPADVIGKSVVPILDLELGELGGEVHDGDRDDLRLPQKTERCAKTETKSKIVNLYFKLQ